MTTFEIAYNITVAIITAGGVFYLRHLVKTSGEDPIEDPERVKRFKESAPYHLIERNSED